MRSFCALVIAMMLLTSPAVAQVSPDSMGRLLHDDAAPKRAFSVGEVSGFLKYRKVYASGGVQPLKVAIRVQSPAKLYCMDAADFKYDLRNSAGQRIQPAQISPGTGAPIPPVPKIGHIGGPTCRYESRNDGDFLLHLDEIFPSLPPDRYSLQLTFQPRDGSVPSTQLPMITFSIK
jgi:hypothetical protein